jgi:predicted nucleotidyltransferase
MKNLLLLFFLSLLFNSVLFPQNGTGSKSNAPSGGNSTNALTDQFTEQTSITLTGLQYSSADWGDYDNDGDLDILLTGSFANGAGPVSKIYKNNGDGSFTEQTSISLTGVENSSIAWGDYDNDGDLDILLTGYIGNNVNVSKIYKNNGDGIFVEQTTISLSGVQQGSVAWGDYDNDGDLDILLTGSNSSRIYKNNGDGTFTEQTSIALAGVGDGSVAWGDYDNDGDLNILLTGFGGAGFSSKIYKNNGDGSFIEQTTISLTGVSSSSIAWGDYDNDGDLDILLTGTPTGGVGISQIYKNNGDGTFTEQTSITLYGVKGGSVAWGDYDNDGDLDILLTGTDGFYAVSKIYKNNGDGTFTDQTSIALTGVFVGSAAWGDYDNDGDLDILLTGVTQNGSFVSKIYKNNNVILNTVPNAPTNLTSTVTGNNVTFNWNKSTDNETPQNGLHYNLVIGTTANSLNTLSPMADRSTGFRRVVRLGNSQTNSWTINDLPNGTYYWSVQAIDGAYAGSQFASTQTITVAHQFTRQLSISLPGVDDGSIAWGDYDNDGDLDILLTGRIDNNGYVLSPKSTKITAMEHLPSRHLFL